MDFDTAYLNASLKEDIYMKIPEEYGTVYDKKVLKLQKNIYGLKQAGCEWFKLLKSRLLILDWKQIINETCLLKN